MDNRKLILLGNGGHCRSVMDSVYSLDCYDQIAIVEKNNVNCTHEEENIIGTDDDLPKLFNAGWKEAIITVGSIGNTRVRELLYSKLKKIGFKLPVIIDPSAVVSTKARICEGVFIGKRAVVNSGVLIDSCAIINTGAVIEHDCAIGKFAHVSPGTTVCGEVRIGSYSHIGAGSVVRQQITIGEKSLIGAGSVVIRNIPDEVVAFGNPCKIIRSNVKMGFKEL